MYRKKLKNFCKNPKIVLDNPGKMCYNEFRKKGQPKRKDFPVMKAINFQFLNNYTNKGQNAEQSVRFALTGKIEKADNLPHHLGGDCLNFQIKSARATICKGLDLKAYLDLDGATAYIYATQSGVAYLMSREEYERFCGEFATATTESQKNGGGVKLRLKSESKAMLDWLAGQI